MNPAEAVTAAQLEEFLGKMERAPAGASYDYITSSGQKIDIMYSTKNLTQKEIDGLNKFYWKNMQTMDSVIYEKGVKVYRAIFNKEGKIVAVEY